MMQIEQVGVRSHTKASETYVDVVFHYEDVSIETSVPIEYRRTGTSIPKDDRKAIETYLFKVYDEVNPIHWEEWKKEQDEFWKDKSKAFVTKEFFDVLAKTFEYTCVSCSMPNNRNFARRIQRLKEMGYTISTKTSAHCPLCGNNTTQLALLPIARGGLTGYETWSAELRKRIVKVLQGYDVFEAKQTNKDSLLPDHKFSEIRWDENTKRETLENLTDEEILRDFQLISNQRNQQKREVCRNCYQTGKRGVIFGIPFFYEGDANWNNKFNRKGKDAEPGCVGCGWYDIERWRQELIKRLQ